MSAIYDDLYYPLGNGGTDDSSNDNTVIIIPVVIGCVIVIVVIILVAAILYIRKTEKTEKRYTSRHDSTNANEYSEQPNVRLLYICIHYKLA